MDEDFDDPMAIAVADQKEEDLSGDGGVIKILTRLGIGDETPEKGDEVHAHYRGTLEDGTEFDASRNRGEEPFKFRVGEGQVIKAWDLAFATMKCGEKATIIAKAPYAYGEAGSPPKIPADATLKFEVECITWRSGDDVTKAKDGGVTKKTLKAGSGWKKPHHGETTIVSYVMRDDEDNVVQEAKEKEIVINDFTTAPPCIHLAVQSMLKGEEAMVKSEPHYHGIKELDGNVKVELTLHSWQPRTWITDERTVCKVTVEEGQGYEEPNEGATVEVEVEGARVEPSGRVYKDATVNFTEVKKFVVLEGDSGLPHLLEEAIMKMKKDEIADIEIKPVAAENMKLVPAAGDPALSDDEMIVIRVRMNGFLKAREVWELKDHERIKEAERLRGKANELFKAQRLELAQKKYQKAIRLIDLDKEAAEKHEEEIKTLQLPLNLNMSLVQYKQGMYRDALKYAQKALDVDDRSIKGWFRKSQALTALGEYVQAWDCLKKAQEIDPEDKAVKAEMIRIKQRKDAQQKKDQAVFSKMFSKSIVTEEPNPAPKEGDDDDMDQDVEPKVQ
eukprot:Clim_evm6s128 gene=Clim_evmTU6s128